MVQLMPLPLAVSCFSKIQIGFTFLVPAHLGSPKVPLTLLHKNRMRYTNREWQINPLRGHFWDNTPPQKQLAQLTKLALIKCP